VAESPRLAWVKAHVVKLTETAAKYGATRVCLCGSVARGEDTDKSDLDFFVMEFDDHAPDVRGRAEDLVREFRALSPYGVDVRGIPGWFLDPPFEATMRREAIELSRLVE
jgi:predicted nucleotidyltransferase